jgi:chemotaxis protein methyltransferase CheR
MSAMDRLEIRDGLTAGSPVATDAAAWERLRLCVEAETGMDFSGKRLERLQSAVRKAFPRRKTAADLEQLVARWDQQSSWLDQLAAELTVGESFFFRNEHHFHALREQVIPEILRDNADQREIRIWSAGCATGEEPYSLAILLDQILRDHSSWRVYILGTDVNHGFLERARQAWYRPWSFRHTTIHNDRTYFTPEADAFRLTPRVSQCVRFADLNLVKDVYPSPLTGTLGLDLILFRNVAIYLKPEVTQAIISRFRSALRPGGWLLLGETEVNLAPVGDFQARRFEQATFYQKPRNGSALTKGELLQPPPMPVLASISFRPEVLRPTVRSLPDWVPLPKARPRTNRPVGSKPSAATGSAVSASSSAAATWERVERLIAERNFDEAALAIGRIGIPNARAALRLR